MFTIKGFRGDKKHSITWDDGSIDNDAARKVIVDKLIQFADESNPEPVTTFQQQCVASLSDSVFCFWILTEWLDVVESVEGETGIISEDGVVY